HADEHQKAVEQVEDFLIGKRLNALFQPQQVRAAAKLLYHTKGQFRVAELADRCHVSARQLERQFDQTTGVSPKALARTFRFEVIPSRLMFQPETNLTNVVALIASPLSGYVNGANYRVAGGSAVSINQAGSNSM